MKKLTLFFLLLMTLMLAGCSMPFVTPENEVVEKYIEGQAQIVKSSVEVHQNLQVRLEEVIKKKKNDFPYNELIHDVDVAKDIQQSLYDKIMKEKAPYGNEEMKGIYLELAKSYLDSYQQYKEVLWQKDVNLLNSSLEKNKIKQESIANKSLLDLNYLFKKIKISEQKSLTEIVKESKKQKEKK